MLKDTTSIISIQFELKSLYAIFICKINNIVIQASPDISTMQRAPGNVTISRIHSALRSNSKKV